MKKNLRFRFIFILAVTLGSLFLIFVPHDRKPTLDDFTKPKQITQNLQKNVKLGLDLKGGIHLVMQVQAEEAVRTHVAANAEAAKTILEGKDIALAGDPVADEANHQVTVKVADAGKATAASDELIKDFNSNTLNARGWTSSVSGDTITLSL